MKKLFVCFLLLFFPFCCSFGQVDPEPLSSINYQTVERLEIKSGSLINDLHFTMRPINRDVLTNYALYIDSSTTFLLSDQDNYNLNHIFLDNNDLVPSDYFEESVKPVLKYFYKTPAHLFDVHTKGVDVTIDPIFYGNLSYDSELRKKHGYINTRGIQMRASLDDWLSVYSTLTENQARYPNFLSRKADSLEALPGKGFYQKINGNKDFDFFNPTGGILFDFSDHVNLQFAYDKHFIGDGYRSLFTSENSNSSTFLNLGLRFWKINYANVYEELISHSTQGVDSLAGKKYKVSHHLSFDVAKWLNIGFFESIVFARENHFEFSYLNPIIFYRAMEQQLGSPDNALIGLNYSAIAKRKFKFYGQLVIDEFRSADISSGNKSWTNKFAFQQGIKYIDAFKVNNLDVQAEVNRTRPYTYSHRNLISSYTHYGQAIAHPLGANFTEFVGIANYQPIDRIRIKTIATYADYGRDPNRKSWGGDIINKTTDNRPFNTGVVTGQGVSNKSFNLQALLSYELKHNLNFDLQSVYKHHQIEGQNTLRESFTGASIRWNFGAYDFNY